MKHFLSSLIVFTATLAVSVPCQCAEVLNRTALLIGIGTYSRPEVPSLGGVKSDMVSATAIAKAMGIPDANIRVLRDLQATKANILAALAQLGESTPEGARTFVYFSGHGTRWLDPKAGGCVEGLLTYDDQTITNSEIATITQKLSNKADKFVVMFDACHSGGVAPDLSLGRSVSELRFVPKFYQKADGEGNVCSQASNYKTRGLLGESIRLGALSENFVQITSSLPTEVSFDEPAKGGLATQGGARLFAWQVNRP